MKRTERIGFTLVEVLIVVTIIAILAAVLIQNFGHASDDARYTAAQDSLQNLRDALQLYRNQHQGRWPGVAGAFPDKVLAQQLTLPTSVAGERSGTADQGFGDPKFPLGPYVPSRIPPNPFNQSNKVQTVTTFPSSPPGGVNFEAPGWIYEITSGRVRINWDGKTPDGQMYWDVW